MSLRRRVHRVKACSLRLKMRQEILNDNWEKIVECEEKVDRRGVGTFLGEVLKRSLAMASVGCSKVVGREGTATLIRGEIALTYVACSPAAMTVHKVPLTGSLKTEIVLPGTGISLMTMEPP